MRTAILLSVALLCLPACYTSIRATDCPDGNGIRYYLPVPVLVVKESTNGQWDACVEVVADCSREFRVQPTACLAKCNATFEFHPDGTLKQFALDQDSTTVSSVAVSSLKSLLLKTIEQAKKLGVKGTGPSKPKPPDQPDELGVRWFKIEGDKPIGWDAPELRVEPPWSPLKMTIEMAEGESHLVLSVPTWMPGAKERGKLVFLKSDKTPVTVPGLDDAAPDARRITLPIKLLHDQNVRFIRLGADEVEIPWTE